MAARAAQRRRKRDDLPEETPDEFTARMRAEQMAEHPEWFSPVPPDDGSCLRCSTWRIENREMGRYSWWATCPDGWQQCTCTCHPDQPGSRIALAVPVAGCINQEHLPAWSCR